MTDYIKVSDMPARLADASLPPLWIAAAYEPDPDGKLTVSRPVASVVADDDNPGEWVITYAAPFRKCRDSVRAAGGRRFAVVPTKELRSADGTLTAVVPEDAACQQFAMCPHPAVALRPHPVLDAVPVCERHTA